MRSPIAERFLLTVGRDETGRVHSIELDVEGCNGVPSINLNGLKASLVSPRLWGILSAGGVTTRGWTGNRPIELEQTTGAHAWLLLAALQPLRRIDRPDEIADGIEMMSTEEAAYWYARASRPRGLRALRLLLSNDDRRSCV
ncbi:MAG: hypothetical protein WD602_06445 [Actinomycetota bacterium]